jgi:hypothetical protein
MINLSPPEIHPKFPILHGYVAKAKTAQELQKCWRFRPSEVKTSVITVAGAIIQ